MPIRPPAKGYAGFGRRAAAWMLDQLAMLIGFVAIATLVAFGMQVAGVSHDRASTIVLAIGLAIWFGFFPLQWRGGSTPGMETLRIRVEDPITGKPIGLGRALLRFVGYLLAIAACGMGLIWVAVDSRGQG